MICEMRAYSANRGRKSIADGTKREGGVTTIDAGTMMKRNGVQPGRRQIWRGLW